MTDAEGRTMALAGIALLAVSAVRWGWDARRKPLEVPGDTATATTLLEASRAEMKEEDLRSRPLGKGEKLDPNRASAVELDRLPGVGPSTGRAIVREREQNDFFRRPEDLLRVQGVGPATLKRLLPHLDFSRPPPGRRAVGVGARRAASPALGASSGGGSGDRIDLNRADEERLQELQGVGPALARRIVEFRKARGPFQRVEDLLDVRGIGPATLERLRDRIRLGG